MYSHSGKILYVDLTAQRAGVSEIGPALLKGYLGGVGLATRLLYHYAPAGVDPFSPQNPLVFAAGALAGTIVPTSSKHAVATKSPLTGLVGDSISSSFWSATLKRTGFDAIVITGCASSPTYLFIDDGIVHFKKAEHLWGKGSMETEEAIRDEIGDTRVRVAMIGPAGENRVRYACISNDNNRQAGRTGTGAVMGSKRLKAIALRGTQPVLVRNVEAVEKLSAAMIEKSQGPSTEKYRGLGTPSNVLVLNRLSALPARNFQSSKFAGAELVSGERLAERYLGKVTACSVCPVACTHIYVVPAASAKGIECSLDYESLFALGPLCGIDDVPAILKAAELCDHFGVDTISAGSCIAWGMECYEKGLLTKSDTAGLELRFGNSEALVEVIGRIAGRKGVGDLLAEGVRIASSRLGRGSGKWAMHSKGLELSGYEPRTLKTMALGFAVGLRGACHNRSPGYETDMSGQVDRLHGGPERGQKLKDGEDFAAVLDSLVICKFIRKLFGDFYGDMARLYSDVTGFDMTAGELKTVGERVNNVKKAFNIREGWKRSDDWLPERLFTDPVTEGEGKGTVITTSELNGMIDGYYEARGWTREGLTTPEKLKALEVNGGLAPAEGLRYGTQVHRL